MAMLHIQRDGGHANGWEDSSSVSLLLKLLLHKSYTVVSLGSPLLLGQIQGDYHRHSSIRDDTFFNVFFFFLLVYSAVIVANISKK